MSRTLRKAIKKLKQPAGESWAVPVRKTSELVADHFRGQIVRGELREGDTLPSEGQLIASLGISRPTLREALRIIENERLISVNRGSRTGARVHKPRSENVSRFAGYVLQSEGVTLTDIFDARRAIEPYVVRQLAVKKDKKAIAQLRAEVERLTILGKEERYVEFVVEVAEFHRLLVELGGNRTLGLLTQTLSALMARNQVEIYRRMNQSARQQHRVVFQGVHSMSKMIDLVEAAKANAAAAHWELHLINANRRWTAGSNGTRVVESLG